MRDYELTRGYVSAPSTELTRGWRPTERRDYRDGLVCVTYWRESADGWRARHLIWERMAGWRPTYSEDGARAGFLWSDAVRAGDAVRAFRRGARARWGGGLAAGSWGRGCTSPETFA